MRLGCRLKISSMGHTLPVTNYKQPIRTSARRNWGSGGSYLETSCRDLISCILKFHARPEVTKESISSEESAKNVVRSMITENTHAWVTCLPGWFARSSAATEYLSKIPRHSCIQRSTVLLNHLSKFPDPIDGRGAIVRHEYL